MNILHFLLRFSAAAFSTLLLLLVVPWLIISGSVAGDDNFVQKIAGAYALFNAGYFLIAALGIRIAQSFKLRAITATLLTIPICLTAAPLVQANHPEARPIVLPILLYSLLLFSAFVWPVWLKSAEQK